MLPESVGALFALLGLVAPGLIFHWTYERDVPTRAETSFREVSRIALFSLAFTWAAVVLFWVVHLVTGVELLSLGEWIASGRSYVADHVERVASILTLTVVLSCGLAALASSAHNCWRKRRREKGKGRRPSITYTTPWFQVLNHAMGSGRHPWVLVKLKSGTDIWGKVDSYTAGPAPDNERQIVITGPGLAVRVNGSEPKEETYWQYIMVNGSEIDLIKVAPEA